MAVERADPEVEALEIRLLLEAIAMRHGYDLRDYADQPLVRRVHATLASTGLAHLGELQHRVLTDNAFFADVLEGLTLRVSEMFRDPPFYAYFRRHVVPVLRTYPLLKIWHGGVANGEEAYTSAVLLSEEGLYERCQIFATDLSPRAVARAKQGVYPLDRARIFSDNHQASGAGGELGRYFTAAYGGLAMNEGLKRNIHFFQHDLVADHVFGQMNVVFCRNVLIYFNATLRERVLDKLADSLCLGGYLCLGSSESLPSTPAGRRFSDVSAEHRIYRLER